MASQPTNNRDRLIKGDPLTGEKTPFRGLRYSNSEKKNGQPFIVTDIPDVESEEPTVKSLGGVANNILDSSIFSGKDFLLRTGTAQRSLLDVERLSKFFTTTPGLLFATKQNLLSGINVSPQGAGILGQGGYLPTNTLAQLGVVGVGGSLVKQGLDPFRDLTPNPRVPRPEPQTGFGRAVRAVGDFLSGINDATTFPLYLDQVPTDQPSENNRLVNLRDSKISSPVNNTENLGSGLGNLLRAAGRLVNRNSRASQFLGKVNDILDSVPGGQTNNVSPNKGEILLYGGGPGAFLGTIGKTIIKRYSDTTAYSTPEFLQKYPDLDTSGDINAKADSLGNGNNEASEILPEILASKENETNKLLSLYNGNVAGLTQQQADAINNNLLAGARNAINTVFKKASTNGFISGETTPVKKANDTTSYNTDEFKRKNYLLNSEQIKAKAFDVETKPGTILPDFRQDLLDQQSAGTSKAILSAPLDYTSKNISTRVGIGDPGTQYGKDLTSYTRGSGLGPVDKVNALPLYESPGVTANSVKNDLVKFRISAPDTDNPNKKTYIHFRAYLDGMVDNFNSNWNPVNYMGRTDPLFRFTGFNRNVVMSWTIAAQSREELMVMYTKLNYLQSLMTGDYTSKGYMAGNFVNMTVGGYFWETPCIINSMNITIPNESPWEIGIPDPNPSSVSRNAGQTIDTDSSVREMPHIIQVTGFSFTPIHDFAPRKQKNIYGPNGELEQFGKQKFISLTSESGNSVYDIKDVGKTRPDLSFRPTTTAPAVNSIQPASRKPFATTGVQAKPVNIPRPAGTNPSVEVGEIGIGDPLDGEAWNSATLSNTGWKKTAGLNQ